VKRSRPRAFAALFTVLAVLFSQLAVAAYACPGADAMMRAAIAVDEAPPCDKHPSTEAPAPTALCVAHCQQGDQSLEQRGASLPAVTLLAMPSSPLAPACGFEVAALPEAQPSLLERPTGPPLAVRHCRFRI
jgi:hypothetical protein